MTQPNHTTFYIVRHGESHGNALGNPRFNPEGGSTDWDLTEKGRKQAKKLGEKLKPVTIDVAFSSTMNRARQTAELIIEERDLEVQVVNNIHERSLNEYLQPRPELARRELIKQMQEEMRELDEDDKMTYKHGPDMESAKEAAIRFKAVLHELEAMHPQKTILVVNHGNIMRSFLTDIGYATFNELPDGSIENTAYAVVINNNGSFTVHETEGVHKRQGEIRAF